MASGAPPPFVVVGNPGSRRVVLFQDALARRGLPPARVVAYADILAGRTSLAENLETGAVVRIESPGKSFEVERGLIALGADAMEQGREKGARIGQGAALALKDDKGRILYPRQAYLGLRELCARFARELASGPAARVMNDPDEIVAMFDKRICHARFTDAGVSVPQSLGEVGSFDELSVRMSEARVRRVFVKLAHGSSASGVVALRRDRQRLAAITSVERVTRGGSTILYNSRTIREYSRPAEIADIINILCREGAQVEAWLSKATLAGRPFDVRVVTIAGRAAHFVVRVGESPMTNLHLGNPRGDAEAFLAAISPEAWGTAKGVCERAAALFPKSLTTGVDLLMAPSALRLGQPAARGSLATSEQATRQRAPMKARSPFAVLEINAFGDLLPGVLHDGHDTYSSAIGAVLSGAATV
jgi:hypothetical protein